MTTYYAAASGSNRAAGTAEHAPWRDWAPLASAPLRPGDVLRLRGGDAFPGALHLDGAGPVTVESYGTGRAVIVGDGRFGVYARGVSGLRLRGLVVDGAGRGREHDGISLFADAGRAAGVRISDCEVTGWKNGIAIGAGAAGAGFDDVLVSGCDLHGNRNAGLATYGPRGARAHRRVRVRRTRARDQTGDAADTTTNSGSGIVLGSVDNSALRAADEASVDRCVAHGNGAANAAPQGPIGIWCYDATGVIVQDSVSFANRTGTTADGGGFGLDVGTVDCAVRRCAAWDNDGAGVLLYAAADEEGCTGNSAHDNTCWDNARNHPWYGQLTVHGRVGSCHVRRNTCTAAPGGTAPVVALHAVRGGLVLRDNLLVQRGRGAVVGGDAPDRVVAAVLSDNAVFDGTAFDGSTWPSPGPPSAPA